MPHRARPTLLSIWISTAALVAGCGGDEASTSSPDTAASSSSAGGAGGVGGTGGAGGDPGPNVPPGCERAVGRSACSGAPGVTETTVEVAGTARKYRVYAPSTAAGCAAPVGLLFFFHGLGGDEHQFDDVDPLAEQSGLVLVQALGSPQSWAGGSLGWVPDGFDDNVELVRSIRATLEQGYDVDPYRVWMAGFSQGAFMAAALASPDAVGNEITGVGVFGGGEEANTCPVSSCYTDLACKVPFFLRVGTSDPHLPYAEALRDGLLEAGWPEAQLDFQTFPGGHTIRGEDVEAMLGWLGRAYPHE